MDNYSQLINSVVNNKTPDGTAIAGRNSYSSPINLYSLWTGMKQGNVSLDNFNKVATRLGVQDQFDPSGQPINPKVTNFSGGALDPFASSIVIGGDNSVAGSQSNTSPAQAGTPAYFNQNPNAANLNTANSPIARQLGAINSSGSSTPSPTLKGNSTMGNGFNYGSPDIGYFKTYNEALAALKSPVASQLGAVSGSTSATSTTTTPNDPANLYNTSTGQSNPYYAGTGTNDYTPTSTTDLENQYKALLGPSTDETSAQKAIDDQNNAAMVGETNVGEQPIASSFITGQQASIEKRNTEAQIPLQQRLANAQQQRQASLDAVKFELDRADSANTAKETAKEAEIKREDALNAPQSVSDQYGTGIIGEYNFAKANGYTGSFTQYQNEDANRTAKASGLTPAQTAAQTTKNQANDVASAVVDFQNQIQQRGWTGANPDAYNHYRSQLITQYGAQAALALDKAMSDAGIIVDYTHK